VAGIRVFVVEGRNVLQRQGTVLVHGMQDFPLIDTPEAMCGRQGKTDDYCVAGAAVGYLQKAKVIAVLPYSQALADRAR
jgi:hypothetical protein